MGREQAIARQIRFTNEDFEGIFEGQGIDFYSLTDQEWRAFEKMFLDGCQWSFAAEEAAWIIKYDRDNLDR